MQPKKNTVSETSAWLKASSLDDWLDEITVPGEAMIRQNLGRCDLHIPFMCK